MIKYFSTARIQVIAYFLLTLCCDQQDASPNRRISPNNFEVFCGVLEPGTYSDVNFPSKMVGYATTVSGEIYKTQDGGSHWEPQISHTDLPLNDIFFFDNLEGYIVGGGNNKGIILNTIDGGASWIITTVPVPDKFY